MLDKKGGLYIALKLAGERMAKCINVLDEETSANLLVEALTAGEEMSMEGVANKEREDAIRARVSDLANEKGA